ncbi:ATP-binding cassette domain-containing protein [Sporosarcina siberiensis]|uniref:ATP-binding cassette domain-containing protein n=1 Tax=Sporosarcina siberiensis TaxID=1365606 RepID=A0ABW4SFC3_9BACL
MNKIIEVQNVSKSFGKVMAINDISFYVEKGSLFSFLGTNGAGKSTMISIILTLLKQDKGEISVNGYTVGKNDHAIRKEIGVVFQESVLDSLLTVKENLHIRGSFYGLSKKERTIAIEKVAEIVDCTSFLNQRYGKLSGGQKRRADIARALIHQPTILILDEPTTGLDAQNRKYIWEMIQQLQQESNMTIFLTTHYIEEAANSDFVVVMKEGSIITKGTPEQLKNTYSSHQLSLTTNADNDLREAFISEGISFREEKQVFHIHLQETIDAIPILAKYEQSITSFEVRMSSLDDVFISITGKDMVSSVRNR